MLPIGPTPIFPKHLVVDVSNNVQTIDVHERNAFHFIAQALYQASHVQETIISWILIMAEYIMQTTIQAIFVLIQLSWFYCWKATIGLTKIDAWLVMIHSWYFDRDFHARSKHKLINEDQRKRPRRAIRKMFPGISRRKLMSNYFLMHSVNTPEQNMYASARRTKRWSHQFDDRWDPPTGIKALNNFRLTCWNSSPRSIIFDELNLIFLSLAIMFGVRIHQMIKMLFAHHTSRFKFKLKWSLRYLRQMTRLVSNLFLGSTSSCHKMTWTRVRTKLKQKESRSRWSRTRYVLATVYNIDQKMKQISENTMYFDTDTTFIICDNSSNVHICNDKRMFQDLKDVTSPNVVATIGGKNSSPSGVGTVKWTWKDDDGKDHTFIFENVLYFPNSPVNVLSVTSLADFLNDDEGTGIDTKRKYSRFYWDHGKHQRTFHHSDSNLPPINQGTSSFSWFTRAFARKLNDQIHGHCCCTNKHLEKLADDKDMTTRIQPYFLTQSFNQMNHSSTNEKAKIQ
jgi:hypothetical protein